MELGDQSKDHVELRKIRNSLSKSLQEENQEERSAFLSEHESMDESSTSSDLNRSVGGTYNPYTNPPKFAPGLSFHVLFVGMNLFTSFAKFTSYFDDEGDGEKGSIPFSRYAHYVITLFSIVGLVLYFRGGRNNYKEPDVSQFLENAHSYSTLIMSKVSVMFCFYVLLVSILQRFRPDDVSVDTIMQGDSDKTTTLLRAGTNIYSNYVTTALLWWMEPEIYDYRKKLLHIDGGLFVWSLAVFLEMRTISILNIVILMIFSFIADGVLILCFDMLVAG